MKSATSLLFACLTATSLAGAAPARAQADPFARQYTYMLSAGELRSLIEQGKHDMVIGYISGVMDAMVRQRELCVPADINPGILGAKAFQLMKQQPRESRAPAADVIGVFLHADYPCGKG